MNLSHVPRNSARNRNIQGHRRSRLGAVADQIVEVIGKVRECQVLPSDRTLHHFCQLGIAEFPVQTPNFKLLCCYFQALWWPFSSLLRLYHSVVVAVAVGSNGEEDWYESQGLSGSVNSSRYESLFGVDSSSVT